MPANRFNGFTDYGIGIGLRVPHYRHILAKKPVVDWFEIISENFMVDGGRPLEVLDAILEQYRVVQHGVAIYFGSADRLNWEQVVHIADECLYAAKRRGRNAWAGVAPMAAPPPGDTLEVLREALACLPEPGPLPVRASWASTEPLEA